MRKTAGIAVSWLAITNVVLAAMANDTQPFLDRLDVSVNGFLDSRAGARLQSDAVQDSDSLGEARVQIDLAREGAVALRIRSDFLYDSITESHDVDLDDGTGFIDLREANLLFAPTYWMDVKAGRQILTWGTGDLLFINDLFPKDWQAFFTGRDVEYLKAPSDAIFVSLFPPGIDSLDVAYTPAFDADRFISGERLSYWNPMLGRRAGQDAVAVVDRPDEWFGDDEVAVRLARRFGGFETAAYFYDGRWKTPQGFDPAAGKATFPRLSVYGASVRGPGLGGLVNFEAGYNNSRDDRKGDDPLVPNSELRGLLGYERELARDLSGAVQYYVEHIMDHDEYAASLPGGMAERDQDRHVVTLRLTRLLMNQDLVLGLFAYYSPSDSDGYVRPSLNYKVNDEFQLFCGGNLFAGEESHTFFGQFEDNSNVYGGVRYSY